MKIIKPLILIVFILKNTLIFSQLQKENNNYLTNKKILNTTKANEPIKIDGVLDEPIWSTLESATDFTMFEPGSGKPAPNSKKTEVKITYTEEAIYIGAYLYDDDVSSIPMEVNGRDNFGQADYFFVVINPNNDALNDVAFVVFSSGSQADAKVINGNEDFSWNAVWDSSVKINDDGWVVEMKIPYLNLRFSNQENQVWGINFARSIQSLKEKYSWNFVDKTKGSYTLYSGLLKGITKIDTPTRLSFFPYASSTLIKYDGSTSTDYSVGLDLKYGINDSFTIDATLIPDFSQTDFDATELNLGPFEQNYSEKRSFFNEGTELFNKGNLFYSRRIGGSASLSEDDILLNNNETVIDYPEKVTMLNALKLSGRTKNGLGIGVFNAITEKTEATIKNESDLTYRKVTVEPLANYNIVVLDQQFNKNSSVSFINTNVTRVGDFRDANVSGLIFNVTNKSNTFNVRGDAIVSKIFDDPDNKNLGVGGFLRLERVSGNFEYNLGTFFNDENFNKRDLGFQRNNNFINYFGAISYRIFEPTKNFNAFRIQLEARTNYRFNPNKYSGNRLELNYFATTKKQFTFGGNIETSIGNQYDFNEPRTDGRYYKANSRFELSNFISTDYRKKTAIDVRAYFTHRYDDSSNRFHLNISPRYRFNNNLSMFYSLQTRFVKNENGYVNDVGSRIIFGERDSETYTNSISGQYNFSTKSALTLSFRHNWTPVQYDEQFYDLALNGELIPNSYSANHDINYNSWNFDLKYNWEFAPGSQIIALYRNSIFNETSNAYLNFSENLDDLFNQPTEHLFSLRLVYFLDYNRLKKKNS